MLEYRQYAKLKSTYADGLSKVIGADGRIHTCFQNTVTATGRLSWRSPISRISQSARSWAADPEDVQKKEGKVLVDADYSQIELQPAGHMAEDEHMIAAFRTGGTSTRITASKVFHGR